MDSTCSIDLPVFNQTNFLRICLVKKSPLHRQAFHFVVDFLRIRPGAWPKNHSSTLSLNSLFITRSSHAKTFLSVNFFARACDLRSQFGGSISLSLIGMNGNNCLTQGVKSFFAFKTRKRLNLLFAGCRSISIE